MYRFLAGNLALVFFITRGLLLPSGSGISSSKISLPLLGEKKEILLVGVAEIQEQLDGQYGASQ